MNCLARSLADMEIKIYKKNNMKVPELQKEMEVISDQLGDAKNKSKHLRDKLVIILDDIEKYLGEETREDFIDLIESRSKLLVTSQEVEEKIILFKIAMRSSKDNM